MGCQQSLCLKRVGRLFDMEGFVRASIIVVTYNSREYLGPCLESIVDELGPDDELIVVDNGSTDGSAELVQDSYPRAHLVHSSNVGYAGGNNRGAAVARGDYLVILNPDTMLTPGALNALLAPLTWNTEIALTTGCIVHLDQPERVNACGNTVHYTGLAYCRGAGQPRAYFVTASEVDAVSGAAFAIRRSVFEELGGFDERFFMYVEDTDLSWRARLAGYHCLYVPGALIEHAYDPAYTPTKAFYLERNRHLMLLKNLSRTMYLRMLPGLLLGEIATWIFLLLRGPQYWWVKLQVYSWLWHARADVLRARHEVRVQRRRAEREIVQRFTYRLEFHQIAGRMLAWCAGFTLHPAFWMARLFFVHGRET